VVVAQSRHHHHEDTYYEKGHTMRLLSEELEPRARAPEGAAPIVAAIDASTASAPAIDASVRLARDLDAPVVFVYVRTGPPGIFGDPVYQRRLTREMARARHALDAALGRALSAGVPATAEVLEGTPAKRIVEFAKFRRALAVVVGARDRRLRKSVSRRVTEAAGRPVMIARRLRGAAIAH
jgi:nucleotide-binding universal stress UspA family protein